MVEPRRTDSPPSRDAGAAGFSLVEALIAAALLLIVAVGVLPLFVQAMVNNSRGNDSTNYANFSRTFLEELVQIPWDDSTVTVAAGSTELVLPLAAPNFESWAQGDANALGEDPDQEGWFLGAPTDKGLLLWRRTTRIHYFNISHLGSSRVELPGEDPELAPGILEVTERMDGATIPTEYHLKEVEVELSTPGSGLIHNNPDFILRRLKAF